MSPLLFFMYVNDMPNPSHHQTNESQFADDAGQWAVSKSIDLAAEYLQKDPHKLARWCAKWRIKLIIEKTEIIIFCRSKNAVRSEQDAQIFSLFVGNRIQCIALYQLHNSQALFNLRRGYYRCCKMLCRRHNMQ